MVDARLKELFKTMLSNEGFEKKNRWKKKTCENANSFCNGNFLCFFFF